MTTTTDATTGPPPVCGDLHVDPGENCDDGNDNPMDGCKECPADRFVFATSIAYQGGEIDGLYGADQRCRTQAALAKLPNFADVPGVAQRQQDFGGRSARPSPRPLHPRQRSGRRQGLGRPRRRRARAHDQRHRVLGDLRQRRRLDGHPSQRPARVRRQFLLRLDQVEGLGRRAWRQWRHHPSRRLVELLRAGQLPLDRVAVLLRTVTPCALGAGRSRRAGAQQ